MFIIVIWVGATVRVNLSSISSTLGYGWKISSSLTDWRRWHNTETPIGILNCSRNVFTVLLN